MNWKVFAIFSKEKLKNKEFTVTILKKLFYVSR